MAFDELDGVIVAPDNHKVLFDIYADPPFVLARRMASGPTPRHTIENTGTDDLVVIVVEPKCKREA